ncbi:hypothetical protein M9458_043787, partial [Cirrhinus mrigala]
MLLGSTVLVHYDGNRPLKLACDASPYGVGAVISHIMDNGGEHPIAFASCTLTETKKKYAQIEREALSIIYGAAIPTLAALRMQRWALVLMAYNYDIENADAMSRLPTVVKDCTGEEGSVFYFSQVDDLPVNTERYHTMQSVELYCKWLAKLHVGGESEAILHKLLDELHHEHPGICRMKALARSILCCLVVQKSPAGAPLHPWRWPERPWQRIHIDFTEKYKQFFLVVIDSHSKWLEVVPMSSITSSLTID